eukprot:Sspe_Gene.38047::Locus_18349_Transcript_1_1_Confidence_1.000_Length_4327::g.38047::m.38047
MPVPSSWCGGRTSHPKWCPTRSVSPTQFLDVPACSPHPPLPPDTDYQPRCVSPTRLPDTALRCCGIPAEPRCISPPHSLPCRPLIPPAHEPPEPRYISPSRAPHPCHVHPLPISPVPARGPAPPHCISPVRTAPSPRHISPVRMRAASPSHDLEAKFAAFRKAMEQRMADLEMSCKEGKPPVVVQSTTDLEKRLSALEAFVKQEKDKPPPPPTGHIDESFAERLAHLEERLAVLSRQGAKQSDVDKQIADALACMGRKVGRCTAGQRKLAVHTLHARVQLSLLRNAFWKWSAWHRLRRALQMLCSGSAQAVRRRHFAMWRQYARLKGGQKRVQRGMRWLGVFNNKVLLHVYFNKLKDARLLRKGKRTKAMEACLRLLGGIERDALGRAWDSLRRHAAKMRHWRRMSHLRRALENKSGWLLMLRYYDKLKRFRLKNRRELVRRNLLYALSKKPAHEIRRRYYEKWIAYHNQIHRKNRRRRLVQQLSRTMTSNHLATWYSRLKRYAERKAWDRRLQEALRGAHLQWRSEEGVPRLTSIEANLAGLTQQVLILRNRIEGLEGQMASLLGDSEDGLVAHLADLRDRCDRLAKRLTDLEEKQSGDHRELSLECDHLKATCVELARKLDMLGEKGRADRDDVLAKCSGLADRIQRLETMCPEDVDSVRKMCEALAEQLRSLEKALGKDTERGLGGLKKDLEAQLEALKGAVAALERGMPEDLAGRLKGVEWMMRKLDDLPPKITSLEALVEGSPRTPSPGDDVVGRLAKVEQLLPELFERISGKPVEAPPAPPAKVETPPDFPPLVWIHERLTALLDYVGCRVVAVDDILAHVLAQLSAVKSAYLTSIRVASPPPPIRSPLSSPLRRRNLPAAPIRPSPPVVLSPRTRSPLRNPSPPSAARAAAATVAAVERAVGAALDISFPRVAPILPDDLLGLRSAPPLHSPLRKAPPPPPPPP